jgi:hypothetical protein
MGKSVAREVKILDAVLKEEDVGEDDPRINQYIWLQLQDVNTGVVYTTSLTLEDIKNLMNAERYLEGRELINFCTSLKSREDSLSLIFDPDNEITVEQIAKENGE